MPPKNSIEEAAFNRRIDAEEFNRRMSESNMEYMRRLREASPLAYIAAHRQEPEPLGPGLLLSGYCTPSRNIWTARPREVKGRYFAEDGAGPLEPSFSYTHELIQGLAANQAEAMERLSAEIEAIRQSIADWCETAEKILRTDPAMIIDDEEILEGLGVSSVITDDIMDEQKDDLVEEFFEQTQEAEHARH